DWTSGKSHRFRLSCRPRDDGEIESHHCDVLRSRTRVFVLDGLLHGGRQALMEAQRYPDDFDGIIAGAPANNQTQLCAWRIAVEARILQSPASVVPRAKLALLNRAVLAACDAIDGVKDGLLTDPLQCHFDPATL